MGANTVHEGIFKSNFTAGRRRENNSAAFGKEDVSNELLGNDALHSCKEAGQIHDGEVLRLMVLLRHSECPQDSHEWQALRDKGG